MALFAGFAAIDLHGDRGDLAAAISAHDDVVASVGGMWGNKDFQARIRLSALLLGHVANAAATTRQPGPRRPGRPGGRAARGRPSGSIGCREERSGTRARRRWPGWPGSTPSTPGCAGWPGSEAPELDDLVAAWRRTVRRSRRSGTCSRWPGRRPGWPRCCAPVAQPPRRDAGGRAGARREARRLQAEPLLPSCGSGGVPRPGRPAVPGRRTRR